MMESTALPAQDEEEKNPSGEDSVPFWHQLSDEECDLIYMEKFAKLQPCERELYALKWFDYRFAHPLRATYMFAQAYREAYRYITAIRFDRDKARYVKGFSGEDFAALHPRERSGFVIARMCADRYGVPYDFWCREAMRYAEKMCWDNMPRPNQLYCEEITNHVLEYWAREQKVSLRRATHPRYAPENYAHHQDQREYQSYLLDSALSGPELAPMSHYAWRVASVLDELVEPTLEGVDEDLLREARRLRALFSQN